MKKKSTLFGGKLLLFCLLFFQYFISSAQTMVAKQIMVGANNTAFLQYKPVTLDASPPTRKYPLIIFLHGGLLQSNDASINSNSPVWNLKNFGPAPEILEGNNHMDFYWNGVRDSLCVLQPLSRAGTATWDPLAIDAMIKYGIDSLKADKNRIYLTGHSWGASGLFNYLNSADTNARKVAAAVPISAHLIELQSSGADSVSNAKLPVWAFHAYNDATTSRNVTINSINRLNAVNPDVKPLLTIWPTGFIQTNPHFHAPEYVYQTHLHPYLEDSLVNIYEWFLGQNKSLPVNILPVARAGNDTTVPKTPGFAILNGSASTDADGRIVRYVWKKISGPAAGSILNYFGPDSVTTVSGLTTVGTYRYQLNVIDDRAAIVRDTLTITVVDSVPSGKAVSFTSSTGRINAGNVTELSSASAFTLEAQFKYDSVGASAAICGKYVSNTNWVTVFVNPANNSLRFVVANGTHTYGNTNSNTVSRGTWHHVAAVFDGAQGVNANRMKIYIDGVEQTLTITGTLPSSTSSSTANFLAGGETWCCQVNTIDEVRVWNTVLSAGTISSWKNKLLGSCHPNLDKLALYWPLDDNSNPAQAAPGLSTSYVGAITSGNYVASTVAVDTVPCPPGKAVSFTSSTGRINAGNVTELSSASAFTLEAHFKYDSVGTSAAICGKYVSNTNWVTVFVNPANNSLRFVVANGTHTYGNTNSNTVSPDTWHHVAAVFDGAQGVNANRMKIYIDGVAQTLTITGTLPSSTSSSTANFLAGGETWCCQVNTIDEVRVWDTVLSSGTISSWKNTLLGSCHPNIDKLALYWPLDDNSNPAQAAAGLSTSYVGTITSGNYVASNQATIASDCGLSAVLSDYTDEVRNAPLVPGRLYPNPTKGAVQMELNSLTAKMVMVHVIDMHGRYVYRKQVQVVRGINNLSLNISSLHSGNYLIDVRDNKGTLEKYRVVKR